MTAPAAVAVIRAVIEDATVLELLTRPRTIAARIATALTADGWQITRDETDDVTAA